MLFADEDRARLGLRLEPRRDVHGVAHRPVLDARAGADRPDHDGSRLHADPDAEPVDPPAPADLVGELAHLLHDPQSGEEGALGVVLVRDRRAEEREHAVAGQVLDRPAERLDRPDDPADRVADHELQLLRLEALPERGGPDEVGEQRGHEPPLLTHRRSRVTHACIVPTAQRRRNQRILEVDLPGPDRMSGGLSGQDRSVMHHPEFDPRR